MKDPAGLGAGRGLVFMLSAWWSFCRHLRRGGACAGLVDDVLVRGERGDQCLEGEVVDRAGVGMFPILLTPV
jgi:hypothetical protein